ncbi:MAG: hypothetical protein ACOCSL_03700 [Thermoplasmatota archaeon]
MRTTSVTRTNSKEMKDQNLCYRKAKLYYMEEMVNILKKVGFYVLRFVQTIFHISDQTDEIESSEEGHGRGSFVVVNGREHIG